MYNLIFFKYNLVVFTSAIAKKYTSSQGIIKLLQNTRHKYFKSIKIPFRSEIKSNKTKRFLAK